MNTVRVITNVLEANDRIARQNAELFERSGVYVVNLMSAPGAGKTTLLERTVEKLLPRQIRVGVIEGDIQSSVDAERIAGKGIRAIQINTGGACHLDGNMIRDAVEEFDLAHLDLLVVENVGNLVCPAEFKVGEDVKVMLASVTEGDDKPLKYPLMYQESSALIINKIDLAPYVDCNTDLIEKRARALNEKMAIFRASCKTGEGIDAWCDWLVDRISEKKTPRS